MQKRTINVGLQGMNQDIINPQVNSKQAYEIKNFRINSTANSNSIELTTERGTKLIYLRYKKGKATYNYYGVQELLVGIAPDGTTSHSYKIVGYCVLNDYLTLFCYGEYCDEDENQLPITVKDDNILRLRYDDHGHFYVERLYHGDLGFLDSDDYRIESVPCYESDKIQKIYWIDGVNYPRVINIVRTYKVGSTEILGYGDFGVDEDPFSFYQKISDGQYNTIKVDKSYVGGLFYAGVIQYAFSFYNLNTQETPIIYTTPLNYVSYSDRGEQLNKLLGCAFNLTIDINKKDAESFDYIRVYSIYRTSLDGTPAVKVIKDIKLDTLELHEDDDFYRACFTDTNEGGYDFDAYRILINSDHIKPSAIVHKDVKLFLANYETDNIVESPFSTEFPASGIQIEWCVGSGRQIELYPSGQTEFYNYKNQNGNNSRQIRTFKKGEAYKFGLQFQDKYGRWMPPCFVNNSTNTMYPDQDSNVANLPYALSSGVSVGNIYDGLTEEAKETYVKVRPVVSYPTYSERQVLCQGIINPTVFNAGYRRNGTCRALASWFFRPFNDQITGSYTEHYVSFVEQRHEYPLGNSTSMNGELQNMYFDNGLTVEADFQQTDLTKYPTASDYEQGYNSNPPFEINGLHYVSTAFTIDPDYGNEKTFNYYHKDTVTINGTQTDIVDFVLEYEKSDIKDDEDQTFGYVYYIKVYNIGNVVYSSSFDNGGTISSQILVKYDNAGMPYYSTKTARGKFQTLNGVRTYKLYGQIGSGDTTYDSFYFVDQSILTMNSPEIEFDKNVRNMDLSGYDVRIVGKVNFINTTGKYNVIAESPLFLNTSNVRVGIADTMTRSANLANGFYDRRTCYWLGEHGRYYRQGRVMSAYAGWVDDICNIFSYDGKVLCGWNDKSAQNLYMMYPWQRQHLNNYNGNQYVTYGTPSNPDPKCGITDEYESSKILKKVLANLRYCETSYDNNNTTSVNLDFLKLFDSDESMMLMLNSQQDVYQGNVDQIINCTSDYESARFSYADGDDDSDMHWDIGSKTGYPIVIGSRKYSKSVTGSGFYDNIDDINDGRHMRPMNETISSYRDFSPSDNSRDPILMRYKSTPHMVFGTPSALTEEPIVEDHPGYLYLGEVYKSSTGSTLFDDTDFALLERTWVPCGPEEQLSHTNDNPILWLEGDTYFQRYDCLKTYPFSNDDYQSVVEIASFMVETHVNLDGRYDQNRGLIDNTYVNPTNFNLINDVYSQDNNFFRYNILDKDRFKVDTFPTRVTWSLNKINSQDIDEWTRTNTAAFMDLDGDKGDVSSLRRFNNQIYAFQQSGISRIKYNENVAIPTNTGAPIELGNSQSVNGKEYISETVGSQNKWSCISTPNGIFFVDNNTAGVYRLSYGEHGIGLNSVTKDVLQRWFEMNNKNGFVNTASYDANMEEVLFTYGDTSEESLAYSNRYGFFSSFYDYQGWIDNIGKHSFNIYDNKIWFLREGDTYNVFYKNGNGDDIIKPYWTSFVASPMFQGVPSDCIFDNVWYRADVLNYSQDETNINYKEYIETMDQKIPDYSINDGSGWYETFDKIEAGNDYQYAISTDKQKFIKKFRMWRVPVPRNQRGQLNAHRDRMRNSWLRFKLENTNPSADKMVLRDVYVDSFF